MPREQFTPITCPARSIFPITSNRVSKSTSGLIPAITKIFLLPANSATQSSVVPMALSRSESAITMPPQTPAAFRSRCKRCFLSWNEMQLS